MDSRKNNFAKNKSQNNKDPNIEVPQKIGDPKKDIDAQRHPEEQNIKDYPKKTDRETNDEPGDQKV